MATASVLPIDIIHNIFCKYTEQRDDRLSEWRETLPLVGISSAWRTAGKKIVYSRAYIEFFVWIGDHDSDNFNNINDIGICTATSNFDLIEQLGWSWRVKRLLVLDYGECLTAPIGFLPYSPYHDDNQLSEYTAPGAFPPFGSLEELYVDIANTGSGFARLCRGLFQAQLSNLRLLNIKNNGYFCEDVRLLLKDSLKVIQLTGTLENVLETCRLGLGSINKLSVFINRIFPEYRYMTTTGRMNELFTLTRGIQEVIALLPDHRDIIYDPMLSWMHLTQLYIYSSIYLVRALASTLRMPNLVSLELMDAMLHENADEDVAELRALSARRIELAESKLEFIIINFVYCSADDEFKSLLLRFSRILPKLRLFEVV